MILNYKNCDRIKFTWGIFSSGDFVRVFYLRTNSNMINRLVLFVLISKSYDNAKAQMKKKSNCAPHGSVNDGKQLFGEEL